MNEYWPVAIAGGLVAASYIHRRLMQAAQPLRLELAEKGELLLANPKLSKYERLFVTALLDSAFSNWTFFVIAIFAVPVVAIFLVVNPARLSSSMNRLLPQDNELKAMIADLSKLHDRITFYNHPIFMLIIEFELLIIIPIAVLLSGLIHGSAPSRANRDEVLNYIEAKEQEKFAFAHRKVSYRT